MHRKPPASLQPEARPALDEILSIEPDTDRVARLKTLYPVEPDVSQEVHEHLVRKEVRTLSVVYNQILGDTGVAEDLVDILLKNSIDTHTHGASDPFERLLYEDDIGIDYSQAGMRAMVVKNWYTPSASRNALIQRNVNRYCEAHSLRPVICLGGITLNQSVGGFNLDAVKKCMGFPGMKYVWMPMVDSYHHRRVVYDDWSGAGLKYTDDHFGIIPEVQDILRFIADRDLVLATGHYGYEDSAALIEEARRLGVNRIEVIHPNLVHTKHTIEQMKAQAERGAKLMFRSKGIVTYPMDLEPPYAVRVIREVGAKNLVHGGDWGQIQNVPHLVGIRWALKILLSYGITAEEIRTIFQDSPAELIGLAKAPDPESVPAVHRAGFGRSEPTDSWIRPDTFGERPR